MRGLLARRLKPLFATEKVIDLAIRPRDRGGSVDELRIWILVEGKSSRRRIMELGLAHGRQGTSEGLLWSYQD